MKPGPRLQADGGCEFVVWAPRRESVEVVIEGASSRAVPLAPAGEGYWRIVVGGIGAGADYRFRLDGEVTRPDPASHSQPAGVHEASRVVDHEAFSWSDDGWAGLDLRDFVIYEIHIGAFTTAGTFAAVASRLDDLAGLGITAIEIMPVAQFPGDRNWGYDGVYPYAVQASYGGPDGLKGLVDECHRRGLAVILDVVYNHLGPEGNYLRDFGPFFTDRYRTPWGEAVNFDGPWSDGVRDYFIGNALHWFERYHIDALRLDAVHAIYDVTARPFLQELSEAVSSMSVASGRACHLIAECDRNDPRMMKAVDEGGLGIGAGWSDDFHHALRTVLTGERDGYYGDFGSTEQVAKAFREGYVFTGEHSRYRHRRHGASPTGLSPEQFVVFAQNHDQVGNRMGGERLSAIVDFESLKLAAAVVLLSPYVPLLFMGEEYGEESPFLYFVSHGDPGLVAAVREGRKKEFRAFHWKGEPPDPQSEETFRASTLRWEEGRKGRGAVLRAFYGELTSLRRRGHALRTEGSGEIDTRLTCGGDTLWVRAAGSRSPLCASFHFGSAVEADVPFPFAGRWRRLLDSAGADWGGPGSTLPERAVGDDEVTLRGRSASLWESS